MKISISTFMNIIQGTIFFNYWSVGPLLFNAKLAAIQQPIFHKAYGNGFPSLRSIMRNISLAFVNSNPFFELPRPISNKIVYIGGIVESKSKTNLTPEFQKIFDDTKSGVVLFSFGSLTDMSTMTRQMKEAFLRAFSHFPTHDFIWKFGPVGGNESGLFANSPNVHPSDWLDQKAVLGQPKLRAFITHCGLNSMNEAAVSGVPMVGIPLFGDQLFNAAVMHHKRVGVYVDIRRVLDESYLVEALQKVLNDKSYKENAKLLQRKLQLSPFKPAEKLVKWVEFAAEFPRLNELNLPFEELGVLAYYSLDVIFVTLAFLVLLIIVSVLAVRFV
ncbi:unnamed protein product, partial [Sphagnum compactum]